VEARRHKLAVSAIDDLWREKQVAIEDGLFLADGAAYAVGIVEGDSCASGPRWTSTRCSARTRPGSCG
jgi:hypothetical protein